VSSSIQVVIGGEAGQGLVTIGQLLARSLVRSGFSIVVTQGYHSRIRGGHNTFAVRVSSEEITAPGDRIDLLIALSREAALLHRRELSAEGRIVLDRSFDLFGEEILSVPYGEFSSTRYSNVAALGVAGSLLGLDEGLLHNLVGDLLGKKDPAVVEQNRKVLHDLYRWCAESSDLSSFRLPPPRSRERLMLNGNEAVALGALSAGLKFCAFYPMTPSTSIPLNLVARAEKAGLIVEQAEDEIAAVNMAIGASFAGAPAMVATSGGGFALMVEGVSLAAMTETPLVIVIAQRPGPATGLPTRTEQGDLEFVLHSGHGEFPRALFAPGSVEECFHLTRRAFALAERYQGPVFLLTDQFLADSFRAVEPFDVENLPPVRVGADPALFEGVYHRFAFSDDGVSPRFLPGRSRCLVVADSDEHTEDGHITEDLVMRTRMVKKRLAKGEGMLREVLPPFCSGEENPELLLVCWGSSMGSVQEAMSSLNRRGRRVSMLHFSQVWPLVPGQFLGILEGAQEVVSVEGNATGQFARLIRRETGFEITKKVLRYDGLPITPEFILRELNS